MSTGIILLILSIIALFFLLNRGHQKIEKPLYRTQYVTEYVPVPVRRPYKRERYLPPRRFYPRNRPSWPPRRQHDREHKHEHGHEKENKPKGFIGGVPNPL